MNDNTSTVEWATAWASRPKLRGWLHVAALPAAVAGTAALAVARPDHRAPLATYAAGLTGMLAASATYHRLTRNENMARWTRPADHAAIYAAIAGTATPFIAATTTGTARRAALGGMWAAAAAGAADRIRRLRRNSSGGGAAYVAIGWAGAALVPALLARFGARTTAKFVAGGAAYTAGAALFAAQRPNPYPSVFGYHETWHLLTLIGAGFHLSAVADVTRTLPANHNPLAA